MFLNLIGIDAEVMLKDLFGDKITSKHILISGLKKQQISATLRSQTYFNRFANLHVGPAPFRENTISLYKYFIIFIVRR